MNDELIRSDSTKIVGSDSGGIEEHFIGQTDRRLWCDVKINYDSNPVSANIIDPQHYSEYKFFTETTYPGGGWQTIHTYNGSGLFFSYHIDSDNDKLMARIYIDGILISEIGVKQLKELDFQPPLAMYQNEQMFCTNGNDIDYNPNWPILYRQSILIQVKRDDDNAVKVKKLMVISTRES